METNLGKFLDDNGLTLEEEIYYANYGENSMCDLCGNYVGMINWNDGDNYLEYTGTQFLCLKCIK